MNKLNLTWYNQAIEALDYVKDPVKALGMKAYMKDRFEYLGIQKPQRAAIQKHIFPETKAWSSQDVMDMSLHLWKSEYREHHYLAMDLIFYNKKKIKSFQFNDIEHLLLHNTWWDSVDFLSTQVLGEYFRDNQDYHTLLKPWYSSENFWQRRACIIFQLHYKSSTDFIFLENRIVENLESKEFFLQKAIGWALRHLARTEPAFVMDIVERLPLKPLSRREATKYLLFN